MRVAAEEGKQRDNGRKSDKSQNNAACRACDKSVMMEEGRQNGVKYVEKNLFLQSCVSYQLCRTKGSNICSPIHLSAKMIERELGGIYSFNLGKSKEHFRLYILFPKLIYSVCW